MNDAHDAFVERELTRHFEAKPDKIWVDQAPGHRVSCAWFSAAKTGRPWATLATIGMSRARMVLDARATDTDTARTELVAYVDDAEGPPEDLAALLRWVGRLPFEPNPPTFLGWGHTIPLGRPQFAQSLLTTVFTINPLVRPDKGTIFRVGDDPVSLLWTTLITDAEYALKKARGENAILDLFAANRHPVALARSRPSYV
ncbi:MAG: hypothetical protein BGO98_41825 [Myxococcales bacterium 68-20]|nr:MAG: hypothetical protein BGO98_41825 [Myxococcales bacterium 68-20]